MADYRSSRKHEDLDPSATSAVGAAYDTALQSLQSGGAELLRYSLAHHLMKAAFAGERDAIFSVNAPPLTSRRGSTIGSRAEPL